MKSQEKINIEICVGTTCHLMGSNILSNITEELPENIKEKLVVDYCLCFGDCHKGNTPPIVKINGKVYTAVTPEKFRKIIFSNLEGIK